MRIISGQWRGRKIEAPPEKDRHIRPTSDRVRENLFNILSSRFGGSLNDQHVADLCAGTGALGFEALSRGAASCLFVDNERWVIELIARNIQVLKADGAANVLRGDVTRLPKALKPVDIILFDPPYDASFVTATMELLVAQNWTHENTLLAMEQATSVDVSSSAWKIDDERRYGKTKLMFFVPA
jgi:16S rRNA (guanine966-N2)-methyltransferase